MHLHTNIAVCEPLGVFKLLSDKEPATWFQRPILLSDSLQKVSIVGH